MAGQGGRKVVVRVAALYVAIGALANAQVEPQPTFRSEINIVQIPVRVLDARGDFVRGLTQSDFQIFEDGQPQTIAAFNAVDIPFVRSVGLSDAGPPANVDVDVSNESLSVDGRIYLFILDNQTMDAGTSMRTRHVLRRFLDDGFAANDTAGIVITGAGRGQSFTRSRRLLDAAIDRFMSDADPNDDDFHRVTRTIADAARSLGAVKNRQKAIVLVTNSAICHMSSSDCRESIHHALRETMQSDVSVYTIAPEGLNAYHRARAEHANPNSTRDERGSSEVSSGVAARAAFAAGRAEFHGPLSGSKYLAEQSGGFAVLNTNSVNEGWARVVRENSAYYLVGYYSSSNKSDGKPRRNEVKVSRRGARVVYRTMYLTPRR